MPVPGEPLRVFCSFAPEDEAFCSQLHDHLRLLERQNVLDIWHKRLITAGTDWTIEVDAQLTSASIILLLISSSFFASDYCYGVEMQIALRRHKANEARIIPILLRPVNWETAPFAHLAALPDTGRPLTKWRNRDAAFSNIAAGIHRAIEEFAQHSVPRLRVVQPQIWNIPYPRNPFFTGRDEQLSELHNTLNTQRNTAISQSQTISGLGGIGKTQLAVEYAYRYAEEYNFIFWVHAESYETTIASYTEITTLLKLPECDKASQAILIQSVKAWLHGHQGWLLIFDNADELEHLTEFLPTLRLGHLLLTTRAADVSSLGLGFAHSLYMQAFSPQQGARFLLQRIGLLTPDTPLEQVKTHQYTYAVQLSQELGGLPLALEHAGAYITTTSTDLATYLQLYQRHLLHTHSTSFNQGPKTVLTTWSLSFKHVEERSRTSADLLRACAFLAPDAIPENLLREGAAHLGAHLVQLAANPLALDNACQELARYSLIQRDSTTHTLSLHRLVQVVIQNSLPPRQRRTWQRRILFAVAATYPKISDSLGRWEWFPHAIVCSSWIDDDTSLHSSEVAHFLVAVTTELSLNGHALDRRMQYLSGSFSEQYYLSQKHKMEADKERYLEAEPLYLRTLAMCEQYLGPTHLETLQSYDNLAMLYSDLGRYSEAEPLYLWSLDVTGIVFGPKQPITVSRLNNLANLYAQQGRYAEAESLYLQALTICKQYLRPAHFEAVQNIATLAAQQGSFSEGQLLLKHARKTFSGPIPSVIHTTLRNLANLYFRQDRNDEAWVFGEMAGLIIDIEVGHGEP